MDQFIQIVIDRFGVPGVLVGGFLFALYKRQIVFGTEMNRSERRCEKELAELKETHTREITALTADRDDYRGFCLEFARHASKMAEVTRAVVGGGG